MFEFGAGVLTGLRNDISGTQTPRRFGTLQDVQIDFAADAKELFGSNQFPVDVARGKTKITGKAKFATIQATAYNDLYFGLTTNTGQLAFVYNEAATLGTVVTAATSAATASGATLNFSAVPAGVAVGDAVTDGTTPSVIAAGTYVLSKTGTTVVLSQNVTGGGVGNGDTINFFPSYTIANASKTPLVDQGVFYATSGAALTAIGTGVTPTTGNYFFNATTGVYAFGSGDASAAILVNYTYTASGGFNVSLTSQLMGTTPQFQMTLMQQFESNQMVMVLYKCVSSKLSYPTKLDDFVLQDMEFQAFANLAGAIGTLNMGS